MTTEKMTVHKALAELKTIDSRIDKAVRECGYVVAVKHSATKINGMTIKEVTNKIKEDYQRVNSLIARRDAMKRAVVMSNAVTKLNINGDEFTVAEAIEMKNHGMDFFVKLRSWMTEAYRSAQTELNRFSGENIEKKAENYILSIIQAQPKDSKMSMDSDAMKKMKEEYIASNTYDLIDPIGASDAIRALDDKINSFSTEVDAALSVSNAVTTIEFEY